MSAIRVSLLLLAGLIAASATAATSPILLPGRWQITIRPELPVAAPEMTVETCLSAVEAERPEPPRGKPTDDCQVVGSPLQGNVLAYVIKCSKRDATTTGRFTYNGDHYDGVVEGKIDGRKFRQVHTAIRLGDCPEPPKNPLP